MPRNKDLKRLVRARMSKTGEAYTTARAQLQKKTRPQTANYAELAGMADAKVSEKTGRTWADWVKVLDGMRTSPHFRTFHDALPIAGVDGTIANRMKGLRMRVGCGQSAQQ